MAAPSSVGRRMQAAVLAHIGSPDVARVIYGSIIGLALVLTLESHPLPAGEMVAALVGTAIAIGLAEFYADLVAEEARTRRRADRARLRTLSAAAAAVVFGAAFPALFFVLVAAGAMDTAAAFAWAKWTGLGLISLYGFLGARLAGASLPRSLVHAVAVGAIGAGIVILKALVH